MSESIKAGPSTVPAAVARAKKNEEREPSRLPKNYELTVCASGIFDDAVVDVVQFAANFAGVGTQFRSRRKRAR